MTHQQLTDAYWEAYLAVLSSAPKLDQPLSPETLCAYADEAAKIAAGHIQRYSNDEPKARPEQPAPAMKYPPCSLVGVKVGDKIEDYTGDLFIVSDIEEKYVRVNNGCVYYHNGIHPFGSNHDTPYNAKHIIPAGTESPERQYTPCDLSDAEWGDSIERWDGQCISITPEAIRDLISTKQSNGIIIYYNRSGRPIGDCKPELNARRLIKAIK